MKKHTVVLMRVKSAEKYIERFRDIDSKEILPEQAKKIIEFDSQNCSNDMAITSRAKYVQVLKELANVVRKPFEKMTVEDLQTYIDGINKKNNPTTVITKKIQIKRFFKFVYGTEGFPDVVRWISTRKSKRYREPTKKILTTEERKALLNACKNQRDRAIITLLDQTGCRAAELVLTRIKDVQLDKSGKFMTITLGRGKTGRRRIAITEGIADIQLWLNIHPLKDDPYAPIIIGYRGINKNGSLQPKGINDVIKHIAARAGIERNIYPHLFRHTRATICGKMLKWNEATMRIYFGWAKDSNMPTVCTHMNDDDVNQLLLQEAGILGREKADETDIKDRICPRCQSKNPFDAKYCHICSLIMDSKIAEKHSKIINVSDEIMDIAQENKTEIEQAIEKYVEKIKMKIMSELKEETENYLSEALNSG
jgi:integrase